MTNEKVSLHNFDSQLIAERVEHGVSFRLYKNRLFHVAIPKDMKIGKSVIESGYQFLDENGGGKFYNIYEFDSFSDVEPEVREWAADTSGNPYTYCDAIVIRNFAQKIITDFYTRVNKPKMPTKIFFSAEKAIDWIIEFQSEIKP